jgi:regulator of protease activity HflC (stomatin/prohibitin superfamily)
MRGAITISVVVLIVAVTVIITIILGYWIGQPAIYFGLAAAIFLTTKFLCISFTEIPADPPHAGAIVFLGDRTGATLEEGIRFLPFYKIKFLFDVILIEVSKINFDLPPMTVRTPDKAEVEIQASLTFIPAVKHIISYLNAGRGDKIKSILQDIIRERLRTWAISGDEGPATWDEAIKANGEALAVITKSILGETLQTIPSDVPTATLLKYLADPQGIPSGVEIGRWGENWERLNEYFQELDPEKKEKIEKALQERRQVIANLRSGSGQYVLPSLGIIIQRLNLSEIKVVGETAQKADQAAKEAQETRAEVEEQTHIIDMAKTLAKEIGMSNGEAIQCVYAHLGKIPKTVQEHQVTFAPNVLAAAEKILAALMKGGANNG